MREIEDGVAAGEPDVPDLERIPAETAGEPVDPATGKLDYVTMTGMASISVTPSGDVAHPGEDDIAQWSDMR